MNRLRLLLVSLLLLSPFAPLPLNGIPPAIASTEDVNGKYQELLKKFTCPSDQAKYGSFTDEGYFKAGNWCGQQTPPGYWVWSAPNWYIWAKVAQKSPDLKATTGGKYQGLISKVVCPQTAASDRQLYGDFTDAGHYPGTTFCGKAYPEAYWVWVDGTWYLWKTKDLAAIGFITTSRQVKLKATTLTLKFDHHRNNQSWADEQLKWLTAALLEMENTTGLAYPGVNPYPIEENPELPLLGLAGPSGMQLKSPPKGSVWTMLHEVVHIWNAGVRPSYVCEGMANFLSFQMMKKFNIPFAGEETYPVYVKEWRAIQNTGQDLPLDDNYNKLPQGKAMAFWAMAYEVSGPGLIKQVFVDSVQNQTLNQQKLVTLFQKYGIARPQELMSGWVRPGPYKVRFSADAGKVAYPLANAWP